MFEAGNEGAKPPVLLSFVFSTLSIVSILFLLVLGNAVYGTLGRSGMTHYHAYGAALLALVGLVFGVIAVIRSFKYGTRKAASIIALLFGVLVFVAFGGLIIFDIISKASVRNSTPSSTPPPIASATPSGPIRITLPNSTIAQTVERNIRVPEGSSQQVVVAVPKNGHLSVESLQTGISLKVITTKDVQLVSAIGVILVKANEDVDVVLEVQNQSNPGGQPSLKIGVDPF